MVVMCTPANAGEGLRGVMERMGLAMPAKQEAHLLAEGQCNAKENCPSKVRDQKGQTEMLLGRERNQQREAKRDEPRERS